MRSIINLSISTANLLAVMDLTKEKKQKHSQVIDDILTEYFKEKSSYEIIQCPDCSAKYSTKLKECPNCLTMKTQNQIDNILQIEKTDQDKKLSQLQEELEVSENYLKLITDFLAQGKATQKEFVKAKENVEILKDQIRVIQGN